jgi:hypothetical protein
MQKVGAEAGNISEDADAADLSIQYIQWSQKKM